MDDEGNERIGKSHFLTIRDNGSQFGNPEAVQRSFFVVSTTFDHFSQVVLMALPWNSSSGRK